MRKYLLISTIFAAICCSFTGLYANGRARVGVEVGGGGPYYPYGGYYYNDNPWTGPGMYFGIHFSNEYDYYNWRRYNYRRVYHHNRYHHGGHHHDGHHGGHH